jgi:hypothetical protein
VLKALQAPHCDLLIFGEPRCFDRYTIVYNPKIARHSMWSSIALQSEMSWRISWSYFLQYTEIRR